MGHENAQSTFFNNDSGTFCIEAWLSIGLDGKVCIGLET